MLPSYLFGVFYLNVNSRFQLDHDLVQEPFAYQDNGIFSNVLHLKPGDKDGIETQGIIYFPILTNSSLAHCMKVAHLPRNFVDTDENHTEGLSIVTKHDIPENTTRIAIAPHVSDECSLAFARQASDDTARALILVKNREDILDHIVLSPALFNQNRLNCSIFSISSGVGNVVFDHMKTHVSDTPSAAPDYGLTRSFTRVGVTLSSSTQTKSFEIWIFSIVAFFGLFGLLNLSGIWFCYKNSVRQRSLYQRMEKGEIIHEGLDTLQLTVPPAFLNSLPIRVFGNDESKRLGLNKQQDMSFSYVHINSSLSDAALEETNDTEESLTETNKFESSNDESTSISNKSFPESTSEKTSPNSASVVSLYDISNSPGHKNNNCNVHQISQTKCRICQVDFVEGENGIRELPCLHIYHAKCIDPVLTTFTSICPICKVSVIPPSHLSAVILDGIFAKKSKRPTLQQNHESHPVNGQAQISSNNASEIDSESNENRNINESFYFADEETVMNHIYNRIPTTLLSAQYPPRVAISSRQNIYSNLNLSAPNINQRRNSFDSSYAHSFDSV